MSDSQQYSLFFNPYGLKPLLRDTNFTEDHFRIQVPLLPQEDDNPSSLFLTYLIQGIGISVVATLGIIGNILSIAVLSTKRMRTSISCLLIGLALCDIVLLLNSLLLFGLPTTLAYSKNCSIEDSCAAETFIKFGRFVPFSYGWSVTTFTAMVYFIVAVTLERYVVVCHPFFARRICTWNRAAQLSLVIAILSFIYNAPRWFEYSCIPVYDTNDDSSVLGCLPLTREFMKHELYYLWYAHFLFFIVHLVFPIVFLVVFNTLIFLKIQESNAERRNLTFSDTKENTLAKMLFVVVAVFIGCNSLYPIHAVLKLVTQYELKFLELLRLFFVVFNSSINFVIYCVYGGRFREVCMDSLKFLCKKRPGARRTFISSERSLTGHFFGDSRSPELSTVATVRDVSITLLQDKV